MEDTKTMAKRMMGTTEMWDVPEIAHSMNVQMETVRRYIRTGKLPAIRFGYHWWVSVDALNRLAQGEYIGAPEPDVSAEKPEG